MSDYRLEEREEKKPKYCKLSWKELREKYNIPKYDNLTKGWFSLRKPLSYGRHFIAITGKRSTGKSTGTSLYILMNYLETGKGWIYTRRTKDEMDVTAPTWFDNAVEILNSYITDKADKIKVEYQGGTYYVNGVEAGIAIPLSLQQKYKSTNLSFADFIIYDEFIAFEGTGYLGGATNPLKEFRAILSLFQSTDRTVGKAFRNEVVIIALGNNDSLFNPLYMGLGVDKFIRTDTHFLAPKGEEWVVMQMKSEDAEEAEAYKDSVGYKLSDERTRDYAYENLSKEETAKTTFVQKITTPLKQLCNLHFDGYDMIMSVNYREGFVYISRGHVEGMPDYALTVADHRPNYTLTLHGGNQGYLGLLRQMYDTGAIRFENLKCKFCIDNFFKFVV